MYSLIKGYISRESTEDEQEAALSEEATQICQLRRAEAVRNYGKTRSKSEGSASPSSGSARYLSWENVSFLGEEIRKTVSRGFQWIAFPSPDGEMTSRIKRKQPEGTTEYSVDNNDTLAKIALRFDTTPSELTRINKLASRMLFPGQTLFVPQKNEAINTSAEESLHVQPITNPPQPFTNKENGNAHDDEHELIRLRKAVSLDDDGEEVTENYLKIVDAKYITDGQGIVNGVLLVTPHSVMFNPNVSDPLVMDRGRDTYCIATPMSAVASAAMYKDIAAMAIHDPLKPGRFHLDAATAESLSRQSSVDADTTPPVTPRGGGRAGGNLEEIRETSPSTPDNMNLDTCSEVQDVRSESNTRDKSPDSVCNSSLNGATDIEDVQVIVQEVLNTIISQITECEGLHNHEQAGKHRKNSGGTSHLVQDSQVSRDLHSVSPVSEDSGIGCSLTHHDEIKTEDAEFMDHSGLSQPSESGALNQSADDSNGIDHNHERQSPQCKETSEFEAKGSDDMDHVNTNLGRPHSASFFSALSNEVKYWLGRGSYGKHERHASESDEDVDIVPKPAAPSNHQPLYLCMRISKKHWCSHHSRESRKLLHGEELFDRDQRRREYWFAIPPSRTEHVYGFFQQWCPNIHNATDEESDDETSLCPLKKGEDGADEEGIDFVETFYSNSPPGPQKYHPKQVSRAFSEGDVYRVKRGFGGLKAKPGKATKVMTSPKPSPDFIDDILPDMDTKSEILKEVHHIRTLNNNLPSRTVGHCWVLVYSTFEHGFSLKTLYRKMECYDTPVLVIVTDGDHQIFGALCSCPLRMSEGFFGTGESFLYKFDEDTIKIFRWTGNNNFFMKGSKDSVAIGSGGGNFGLWLDEDLYHGSSHPCQTYNNEQLSSREDFLCSGLEVWTFV